jgi:hypothetical protein
MTSTPWLMLALLGAFDPASDGDTPPPPFAATRDDDDDDDTDDDDDDDASSPNRATRDVAAPLPTVVLLPVSQLGLGDRVKEIAAKWLTANLTERAHIVDDAHLTGAQASELATCEAASCRPILAQLGAVGVVSASVGALESDVVFTLRVRSATSSARVQRRGPHEDLERLVREAVAEIPMPEPAPPRVSSAQTSTEGEGPGAVRTSSDDVHDPSDVAHGPAPSPSTPPTASSAKPSAERPSGPGGIGSSGTRGSQARSAENSRSGSSSSSKQTKRPPELMLLVYYGLGLVPIAGSPFLLPMAQGLAASVLGPQIVGVDYPDWGVPVAAGYLTYVLGYGVGIALYVAGVASMFSGSIAPVLMVLGGAVVILGTTFFEPVVFHVVASQQAVPAEEAP